MGDVLSEIEETNEDQALEAEQLAVEEPTDQEIAAENRAAEEVPPESAHRLQTELEAESDLSSDSSPSQDKNQRMVNYGALSEERGKRKELESKLAQMEGRFQEFMERAAPKEPEATIPEFDEDPAEHLRMSQEVTQRTVQSLAEQQAQEVEQRYQRQQIDAFAGRLKESEADFAKANPSYEDAASFLRDSRKAEYKMLGWQEHEVESKLIEETIMLGIDAERRGISPAQRFYDIAKGRGFQPKAGSPVSNLQQVKDNQGTTSLGSNGASPRRATLADLADMNDDEFDKATDGDNWKRLLS
jgi:hypothetical protein|tara:strand:+ start:13892 stop:14794 length:903 start_codon:yes stop_codon:yes gene_type:complete